MSELHPIMRDVIDNMTEHTRLLGRAASAEGLVERLTRAATRWPRCCDLWQDGLGGMHCVACAQKTFAMMREVQEILGVDKSCEPVSMAER